LTRNLLSRFLRVPRRGTRSGAGDEALIQTPAQTPEPEPSGPAQGGRRVEVPIHLVVLGMTSPVEAHNSVAEIVQARYGPGVELGTDVKAAYPLDTLLRIPHDSIWTGHPGAIIRDSAEDLVEALKNLPHHEIFNSHYGPVDLSSYNLAAYLRCTRLRILRLHDALLRMGTRNGTILEVGSLFGCFALTLQRLGFDVTAVDRYGSYGPGFSPAIELMRRAGVRIVSTAREDEEAVLAGLGQYDGVISMAVVEHIPHTPRLFLQQLRRHVKTGGVLALDTPNLTRYWNRVKMERGESVFMDIKSQYYADLPYEGHHREYTGPEL
jgi:2-polyprenyl-3-methyl-5-hydroxy-6-metoxy-1,4-benzoquinol methylase